MFLGRAGVLFWDKKYKEAFTLVGWTVGWSLVYLVILLVLIIK
jgi:Na+(H+)/acetate symporter ActP